MLNAALDDVLVSSAVKERSQEETTAISEAHRQHHSVFSNELLFVHGTVRYVNFNKLSNIQQERKVPSLQRLFDFNRKTCYMTFTWHYCDLRE